MLELDNKICHLTFSHTDYADIWPAYFGETKRYLHSNMKHFLCIDRISDLIPKDVTPVVYDSSHSYAKRLYSCLAQLTNYDYVFFDHEDMFLYSQPEEAKLKKYYELMKSGQFDHIRLIKGGSHLPWPVWEERSLKKILLCSRWIFSIQPSFWNRKKLMEILEANLDCNIWQLEVNSQSVVKKMHLKVAYAHNAGIKRGEHHFDNSIYPYVATAIGKGKWNYNEYKNELDKVFSEYNINPKIRGFLD